MGTLGLDLEAGRHLAATELYGDWYRDPWGWPEILNPQFVARLDVEEHLGLEKGNVASSLQPFFHSMEVPKTYLGVRPAVVQDPISRLAYNSAVLKGAGSLHSALPDWVYGWRLRNDGVARNQQEWPRYVESLPGVDENGHGLITDITSFFSSIELPRLLEIVRSAAGRTASRDVIQQVLDAHARLLGRSGLPQRSFASAILANSYMQPIDDVLNAAVENWDSEVIRVRRWMDDISAEGSEDALYGLLPGIQDRARQIGLEINSAKTRLVPARETAMDLRSETLNLDPPMNWLVAGCRDEESAF
ncbi:RNA-directed DNA polymerase [Mycolicibacterium smegmatis]|uniref:RNA-directed DNA polymerase n=1 Tax=Mycolicibacterium smegmatis TaxID=1772 RepID=UPI001E635F0B|nr:RNA-directed DNA polymerase [Mycolicibacterium smegmatis]UGU29880.1 RNA-directed DNA polymerase [Mycolicibacterium smegmatis]ULN70817.1 RNA-directed DNA polymerase [Mycolicibacterium smegmatis]